MRVLGIRVGSLNVTILTSVLAWYVSGVTIWYNKSPAIIHVSTASTLAKDPTNEYQYKVIVFSWLAFWSAIADHDFEQPGLAVLMPVMI